MLLWCDGFDHYGSDEDNMLDGTWAEVSSGFSLSTVNPRTGSTAMRTSTGGLATLRRIFGSALEVVGFGHAFFMDQLPTANDILYLAQFRDSDNASQITVTVMTTGALRVARGGVGDTMLAESADGAVTAGAYQHFECRVRIHDTLGEVEIRINGVTVIDISGVDTKDTGVDGTSQVVAGKVSGQIGVTIYFDDMFSWDTGGSYNNDFIGDHRVRTLVPDQDTAQADWTVTGSATGFGAIDELSPDDDTSYIEATPSDISEFGLENLPAEVSAISAIVAVGRMRKTEAGVCNVQMGMVSSAVGSPPAPAVANGADRPITEVYTYWQDVFEEDPATGAPWTRTAFNAALLRFDRTA